MTEHRENKKLKKEEKKKLSEEEKKSKKEAKKEREEEKKEESEQKKAPEEKKKTEEELNRQKLEKMDKSELIGDLIKKDKIIEDKEKQIKEQKDWKNKFMHLQADFENAQKRWDRSRNDLRKQAQAGVLKDFLPLYDSFTKAIESDENSVIKQFYNQFLNVFKSYKAEPMSIEKGDSFNYDFHEAITSLENENLPENSIIDVIQNGWKIDKDVLRYAKVVISKKPKLPEPEPELKSESKEETPVDRAEELGVEETVSEELIEEEAKLEEMIKEAPSQIEEEPEVTEKKPIEE